MVLESSQRDFPAIDVRLAVERLRHEQQTGFNVVLDELRRNIDDVKEKVFNAYSGESDPRIRGALIELLGESREERFVDAIAAELDSPYLEVRFWAYAALLRIGTDEALAMTKNFDLRSLSMAATG